MAINEISTKPVFIEIYCNNLKIGTATGFQVHYMHKYLITNWHVVSGKHFITNECIESHCAIPDKLIVTYKKYIDFDKYEWVKQEIKLLNNDGNKLWFEHPKYKHQIDVVAIPLEKYPSCQHCAERFELDTNYSLNVTEPVFVVGFPLGYTVKGKDEPHAIWTSGTVASDPDVNIIINNTELPAFLIDSKTRQGQSGSPVIYYSEMGYDGHDRNDSKSIWGSPFMREIGIYSGRINKDSDLGYVWKWAVIKEIIESVKDNETTI